jgi:hypothetical protein
VDLCEHVRFQVLMVASMKTTLFCNVAMMKAVSTSEMLMNF